MTTTTSPSNDNSRYHRSFDGLVEVHILTSPKRYPQHDYRCAVFRFRPTPHTRIRVLDSGEIEFMATKEELAAFAKAFQECDPEFEVEFKRPMVNKPSRRKAYWDRFNQGRHGYKN